jgi:MoaA/NifB/PqqE/SkfB family radical SAM enzyme
MVIAAKIMDYKIGLITNGVALDTIDPSNFEFIRISLDAGTAEQYKRIKVSDHFDKVVGNIELVRDTVPIVGISYVIVDQPKCDILAAELLAKEVGVNYIQFKPENDKILCPPELNEDISIYSTRFPVDSPMACHIAGLVGVITADGRYVYCCQHRYDESYTVADLNKTTLSNAIKARSMMKPNIERCRRDCYTCRYEGYHNALKALTTKDKLLVEHRTFL